jgi:hypothetical protein
MPGDSDSSDSDDDSDNDVPLANIFKKAGAATDPIVLDDSIDEREQATTNNDIARNDDEACKSGKVKDPIAQDDCIEEGDQAWMSSKPNGAATEPIVLNDSIDEGDQATSNDNDTTLFPPTALSDTVCFICGYELKNLSTGLKGRLNHLKRCSKKHGVSARDVKLNDDSELFVEKPATASETATNDNNLNTDENDSWHDDAAIDLALATHCESSAARQKENVANQKQPAKPASKQTTMGNFFQIPVRSLNNVLLAGARRMAKTTELLSAPTKSGDAKASKGGFQKRKDYSKVRSLLTGDECALYRSLTYVISF